MTPRTYALAGALTLAAAALATAGWPVHTPTAVAVDQVVALPAPSTSTVPATSTVAPTVPVSSTAVRRAEPEATTSTTGALIPPATDIVEVAFCGPAYDATPAEWQALAATGIDVAGPPCSTYAYGQPPTWRLWDGTVRYVGLDPWWTVSPEAFGTYLDRAHAVGVRVIAFDPHLWANAHPDLATVPAHPAIDGWYLPEEPTTAADAAAMLPLAGALHEAGMAVWVNVFSATSDEALAVVAQARPTVVSSDDYTTPAAALAVDARVAAAVPGVPHLMAVSTITYASDAPAPDLEQRAALVAAARAQGAGVLWFGWRCPQLTMADGTPWSGGLFA